MAGLKSNRVNQVRYIRDNTIEMLPSGTYGWVVTNATVLETLGLSDLAHLRDLAAICGNDITGPHPSPDTHQRKRNTLCAPPCSPTRHLFGPLKVKPAGTHVERDQLAQVLGIATKKTAARGNRAIPMEVRPARCPETRHVPYRRIAPMPFSDVPAGSIGPLPFSLLSTSGAFNPELSLSLHLQVADFLKSLAPGTSFTTLPAVGPSSLLQYLPQTSELFPCSRFRTCSTRRGTLTTNPNDSAAPGSAPWPGLGSAAKRRLLQNRYLPNSPQQYL